MRGWDLNGVQSIPPLLIWTFPINSPSERTSNSTSTFFTVIGWERFIVTSWAGMAIEPKSESQPLPHDPATEVWQRYKRLSVVSVVSRAVQQHQAGSAAAPAAVVTHLDAWALVDLGTPGLGQSDLGACQAVSGAEGFLGRALGLLARFYEPLAGVRYRTTYSPEEPAGEAMS